MAPRASTSEMTSTDNVFTACNIVTALPELVRIIGEFLDQADLSFCVRVCRSWNNLLIPLLWCTVNTEGVWWWMKFREYSAGNGNEDQIEAFLKGLFLKYGHYIRHLVTSSYLVLWATSDEIGCRNLLSLNILKIHQHSKSFIPARIQRMTSLMLISTRRRKKLMLPWYECDACLGWNYHPQSQCVIEQLWLLIRNNPHINCLKLSSDRPLNDLPDTFIIETLTSMKDLKELDLNRTILDVEDLLNAMPQLEHLKVNRLGRIRMMQRDYSTLRTLHLIDQINIEELIILLDHLPALETLQLDGVYPGYSILQRHGSYPTYNNVAIRKLLVGRRPFISLKTLKVHSMIKENDQLIAMLVQLAPSLVRIEMSHVFEKTMEALWDNCHMLDGFQGKGDGAWLDAWRQRRTNDKKLQNQPLLE